VRDPRDDPRAGDCVTNGVWILWVDGMRDGCVALVVDQRLIETAEGGTAMMLKIVGLDPDVWRRESCVPGMFRIPVEAVIGGGDAQR
jgi:hypothetical protein